MNRLNARREHSFTKPLRVLSELLGFNSLGRLGYMYKNLASLAVTSCSAERAMSRVKSVKDRLRSTMVGDWFSALLILSTEKDLLDCLNENDIVENCTLFFAIAETINTRFPCIIDLSHAHQSHIHTL